MSDRFGALARGLLSLKGDRVSKQGKKEPMASNFKIHVQEHSKELHLKLEGDFDGTSAHQVLNTVQKYSRRCTRIFLHTGRLKHIAPFGRNVFLSNLDLVRSRSINLVFTGENSSQLCP